MSHSPQQLQSYQRKVPREKVVEEARKYLGVRWKHQGRGRNEGLDCVGLIIVVAKGLGYKPFDLTNYSHYPGAKAIIGGLETSCKRIPIKDIKPGDILMLQVNTPEPWHTAIVTDKGMIHAYALNRRVVEHRIDESWMKLISRAYSPRVFADVE